MKYEIGKTVDFNWEIWDYYCNTDLQYEGTERLTGKIESYNEETGNYSIDVNGTLYTVKEDEIIDKAAEFKHLVYRLLHMVLDILSPLNG